jgi:hypothetical protein
MEGWCFDIMSLFVKIFKDENADGEYFLVGQWDCYGARNLTTIKIDSNGNELWRVCFGNEYGHLYEGGRLYTSDGGIINSGDYDMEGGDVGHIFGGYDGWLIKHDRNGNLEWELTLGSQALYESVLTVQQASDGGYYVCMQNESYGKDIRCPEILSNATLVKLSHAGEIEWHECYGCANTVPERQENSGFIDVVELNDGYLFGGQANCNSGDLEGSGWHYGTLNNSPNGPYTSDIWLWEVDNNRNIIWSKCYGGSDNVFLLKRFGQKMADLSFRKHPFQKRRRGKCQPYQSGRMERGGGMDIPNRCQWQSVVGTLLGLGRRCWLNQYHGCHQA